MLFLFHQPRYRLWAIAAILLAACPAFAADWAATRPSVHWSYVAPQRPPLPQVKDQSWPRNAIDRFVLANLESKNIRPSSEAPRATLLRRVSLDLIGLQPTPAELDAFLHDSSPDAYEKAVDRLLASPHYGERWGKHWLDGARYADSNGYSIDAPRVMWRYRDWVIDAFNRDMPFDRFTIEQIAGDMLPNATIDQKIATGFHRNTQINEEGGIDPEQFRVEAIIDRVDTTGSVFLGMTIGCAQCHNHKFDPIAQKDFYRFFAFFNNCDEPKLPAPIGDELQRQAQLHAQRIALEAQIDDDEAHTAKWEATLTDAAKARLTDAARQILVIPASERTAGQKKVIQSAYRAYHERSKRIATLKKEEAEALTTTLVMSERAAPRESYLFVKGDFTRHGEIVTPAVPAILPQIDAPHPTRLDLARWLVDPHNPLTARVTVNRIWQRYFGAGIVETESDFGTQGSGPSNQPLLDYLATEFVRGGWSQKAIHRLIVTSATYRQSSNARPELAELDPYNRLLARQSRIRLDAEIVRDVGLCASGLLSGKIGGPSVFPPQPQGVMGLGQVKREWKTSVGPDRYRRGMYTFLWRANPHPLLTAFDATNATASCTRRMRSNTPLQSLILLNDDASVEFAQAMAARVLREAPADDNARIDYAFKLVASRSPGPDEARVLLRVLKKQQDAFAAAPDEARALAPGDVPSGAGAPTLAAWTIVSRVLLNLDEAITRE